MGPHFSNSFSTISLTGLDGVLEAPISQWWKVRLAYIAVCTSWSQALGGWKILHKSKEELLLLPAQIEAGKH